MPRFRIPVLLLVSAAVVSGEDKWLVARTDNFELFTTEGNRQAKEAIQHFERVRAFFAASVTGKRDNSQPIRIVAFNSEKDFRPFRPGESAFAYYIGGPERDYIVMQQLGRESFPVAVHEYTHLLVKHSGSKIPAWLNEGLAELYSSLRPDGEKVIVGDLLAGRYLTLQQEKWIPLDTLLDVDHGSPYYNEKNKTGIFYAQSWALTHMLNLDANFRPKLGDFLNSIAKGDTAAASFESAYGKTTAMVARDLRKYMDGNRFFAAVFPIKLEAKMENPEIRLADSFELGLALAELHVLGRRTDQARAAYAKLATQNPRSIEVEEGLARLEQYERNFEAAKPHFAKAVELGSKNPRLLRDYVGMLRFTNAPEPEVEAALRKAVMYDPAWVEGYVHLSGIALRNRNHEAALAWLARVRSVKPETAYFFFTNLALANFYKGDKEEALKAATRAAEYAKEDSQKRNSRELMNFVSQIRLEERAAKPRPAVVAEEEQPRMERRPRQEMPAEETVAPPKDDLTYAEGSLTLVDCRPSGTRLHLQAEARKLVFVIEDPNSVRLTNAGGATREFTCGPQNLKVKLGYRPRSDVTGDIRAIEFR
ncbi:MAG: hypothetical protein K2X35_11590 [Bryobacteraceae bacterium]|nr:hypothetical protein [Bryobacteraceae bacterium]